jgi:anthranilate synthase component 1
MDHLSREQFHTIARQGTLVPVYRELAADLETPVSVYLKLRDQGASFLLESVEKAEQIGRYSFLGVDPRRQILCRGREVTVIDDGHVERRQLAEGQDPLHVIASEVGRYQPVAPLHQVAAGLPRFYGGAVGYMGYDLVRFFERLPNTSSDELGLPDVHVLLTDTLAAFDHVQHRLLLFANAHVPEGAQLDAAYDEAVARLDALEARVRAPLSPPPAPVGQSGPTIRSSMTRERYETAVRQAQEYITAGDIFQTVLSQRLIRPTEADPFAIYRALRRINPSPYMFYLDLGRQADRLFSGGVDPLTGTDGRGAPTRRDASPWQDGGGGPRARGRPAGRS